MFFFYVLLIFIIITAILIMFTNIKIHIENLKFTSKKNNGRNLNSDYKITLKIYIDLKEAALNALIVGLFSGIISIGEGILFSQEILSTNSKNEWKIVPLYQNENILKIDFNCIINIKLIHIIYTVYRSSKNIRS
mgnify:CR=1 FL=1